MGRARETYSGLTLKPAVALTWPTGCVSAERISKGCIVNMNRITAIFRSKITPIFVGAGLSMAVLTACFGGFGPWVAKDDACVRESKDGPKLRVINRTDHELCGREVGSRHPVYLRVERPN